MTPHIKKTGTCGECQAERVRLIDMPKPGDVGPNYVCAVCAARAPAIENNFKAPSGCVVPWLPVVEAPKDGTSLLLYSLRYGSVIGSWDDVAAAWVFDHDFGDGFGTPDLDDVTHYSPRPDPPTSE